MGRPGAAAAVAVAAYLLTGCGPDTGPHEVDATPPARDEAAACAAFLEDLPEELAGAVRREVEPADASAAVWGDPPIVLRCGVGLPEEFGPGAECVRTGEVDWFAPPAQYRDQDLDATLTAVGRRPVVSVEVPAEHRPEAIATVMSQLEDPLRRHLLRGETCL